MSLGFNWAYEIGLRGLEFSRHRLALAIFFFKKEEDCFPFLVAAVEKEKIHSIFLESVFITGEDIDILSFLICHFNN